MHVLSDLNVNVPVSNPWSVDLTALSGLCWLTYLSPTLGFRLAFYIGPFVFLVALAMTYGFSCSEWTSNDGRSKPVELLPRLRHESVPSFELSRCCRM
jgi:hypothetical protein